MLSRTLCVSCRDIETHHMIFEKLAATMISDGQATCADVSVMFTCTCITVLRLDLACGMNGSISRIGNRVSCLQ